MKIIKKSVSFEVDPDVIYITNFWDQVISDSWEPETFNVFEKYLSKDHSYIDIGAWIGPTVLFGAQLAKTCYAFEPDIIAYLALVKNLMLNPNLLSNTHLFQIAVGASTGHISLGTKVRWGDSMSSILWNDSAPFIVQSFSLEDVFVKYEIDDCNFIKMDIEGGEFTTLPAAKDILSKVKPTLYLSLHTPWFDNKVEYFDSIIDVLSIYNSFYHSNGTKLTLSEIRELSGFSAIVATDK
jgi:FkbM family methyltransferase